MKNRKILSVKLPPDLIESLQKEADMRGATLTAVIEERLRKREPLHEKLEKIYRENTRQTALLLEMR